MERLSSGSLVLVIILAGIAAFVPPAGDAGTRDGNFPMNPSPKILVDSGSDGGVWWFPQSGTYDPNLPHQGKALADCFRTAGYDVRELPGNHVVTITPALLADYEMVLAANPGASYTMSEVDAYKAFLNNGKGLFIASEFNGDRLSSAFGLSMSGIYYGQVTQFANHPLTRGVTSLGFGTGSVATPPYPTGTQILGYLSTGEPVLGIFPYGASNVAFFGDTNALEVVPQPFTDNYLKFFLGPGARCSSANAPPVADAGGPYAGDEGQPLTLDASASSDPDNDSLTFRWDFDNDSVADTAWSSSPTVTHTWGDDYSGVVRVEVSDNTTTANATATVTVFNLPPVIRPFGPFVVSEGNPLSALANATDPGSDDLKFTWTFENGPTITHIHFNDGVSPDPPNSPDGTFPFGVDDAAAHTYGDDGYFKIALKVEDDDGGATTYETNVTVKNVPPTIAMTVIPGGNEGDVLTFKAHATDPGSDDLTFTWGGSCTGWSAPKTYYNNGVSPDPYPSPDVNPADVWDNQAATCGDNGQFAWSLTLRDDDGGIAKASGTFSVDNLPPAFTISPPASTPVDEGTMVSLTATVTDPGNDDLTFSWAWEFGPTETTIYYNTGVSPDQANSPNGTYPFSASDDSSFIYGHEGNFSVTLTVTDDDGGFITYTTEIDVANVPPTVMAGPDVTIDEGSEASVSFTFSDPGFDMPQAGLYEDFTAMVDWGYAAWPPENVPVVKLPGGPGVPTTGFVNLTHVYGDNGFFTVSLIICDDGGGCGSASLLVTVLNLPPVIEDVVVYATANLTVRVAGEKWHDVRMDMVWNGDVTDSAGVTRYPGSPSRQEATIYGGHIQLIGDFSIVLYYTPADDKVNGQPNGANPVLVIIDFPTGQQIGLKHNFNVQHPSTWVWTLKDLRPYLVGETLTFTATATDPGSDDLTFTWDWGDGTPATATTYYNDGVGPEPYPSPDGTFPFTASDIQTHSFITAGAHHVSLTVSDDDGGAKGLIFVIKLG